MSLCSNRIVELAREKDADVSWRLWCLTLTILALCFGLRLVSGQYSARVETPVYVMYEVEGSALQDEAAAHRAGLTLLQLRVMQVQQRARQLHTPDSSQAGSAVAHGPYTDCCDRHRTI